MPCPRRASAALVGALVLSIGAPAAAQPEPAEEPRDQIVLSGDVLVRRGEEVGEVVVLHGTARVAGLARGDVVVVDGRIVVTGQVSGSVVSVNGPVALGPSAHVRGDVLARGRVRAEAGAQVDGDVRQGATFAFRAPIEALGRFASWLAIWMSALGLGLLLLLFAPRGADAVADVARTRPWATLGWGALTFLALPLGAAIAVVTLVGLPLGLGLLLALFFLYSVGVSWSAFALGRRLWPEPHGRVTAFAIGWAILAAVAAIPFVGGFVWVAGAVFGLGAALLATWRARGAGGRHRASGKMPVPRERAETEIGASTADGALVEREAGQEGVGL
ncbi:MAG TPA: polymer-forming cytoskeletal protein [Solirubrobacterales bacterium]|nr:polymer-forming cytoskeletal protein [Solirubrobacterales bacterium]